MFAGDDDLMWPADTAAKNIKEKRPKKTEAFIYEGFGHSFFSERSFSGILAGGTLERNVEVGEESIEIILDRLKKWHK